MNALELLAGLTSEDSDLLWAKLNETGNPVPVTRAEFVLCLAMLRLNATDDQAEGLFALAGQNITKRTVTRRFEALSKFCSNNWKTLVDARQRFEHVDTSLPATCMLDCTPIPCRFRGARVPNSQGQMIDENYSGKYRVVCFKMEIWTTMQGVPFAFRGPKPGSHHDMRFFDEDFPFKHLKSEMFLGDAGYFGAPHVLLPFKSTCAGRNVVLGTVGEGVNITMMAYWNRIHSTVRSRIERFFSWMMAWNIVHYCRRTDDFLEKAMTIIIFVEHTLGMDKNRKTSRYGKMCPEGKFNLGHHTSEVCPCSVKRGTESDLTMNVYLERRSLIGKRLWDSGYMPTYTKTPAKSSQAMPRTKRWPLLEGDVDDQRSSSSSDDDN
eukprot:PhM_4_TR8344/c3_g2_i3/m.17855